jgi:hypothetical protein
LGDGLDFTLENEETVVVEVNTAALQEALNFFVARSLAVDGVLALAVLECCSGDDEL